MVRSAAGTLTRARDSARTRYGAVTAETDVSRVRSRHLTVCLRDLAAILSDAPIHFRDQAPSPSSSLIALSVNSAFGALPPMTNMRTASSPDAAG